MSEDIVGGYYKVVIIISYYNIAFTIIHLKNSCEGTLARLIISKNKQRTNEHKNVLAIHICDHHLASKQFGYYCYYENKSRAE